MSHKKILKNISFPILLFAFLFFSIISAYGVTIVNYNESPIKVEYMDCESYYKYGFPSKSRWYSNVSRKADYLHIESIQNGYYGILGGSNIPKKLCIKFSGKSINQEFNYNVFTTSQIQISSYDTCTVNIVNNSNTGFVAEPTQDCHSQLLN